MMGKPLDWRYILARLFDEQNAQDVIARWVIAIIGDCETVIISTLPVIETERALVRAEK